MYYALSMAGTGADGETKQDFVKILGWENKTESEILSSMQELYQSLMPQQTGVTLEIANSLWARQGAPIKQEYKTQTQEYFDAEVRELDFGSPEAVDVINSWIEVKTNNLIEDMLDAISPDAIMYLINAVYFNGNWKYEFKEDDNYEAPFTKADNSTNNVEFMKQKTNLQFLSNDLFTSVKLPYTDSNFYMKILVPKYNVSVNDLITEITIDNWNNWNSQYAMKSVTATIPKFKFTYGTRNINDELQALGLLKAYSSRDADFSKITDVQIFISRVLHKAFIEVNEKGSEAAAATIIEFENTSAGDGSNSYSITADKPFVFAICHEPTNSIMFIGKVENIE